MSKAVKSVGNAVGSVVNGAVKAVSNVAKGVGNVAKQIASSKLGKAVLIAAAIYFGGAACRAALAPWGPGGRSSRGWGLE
jgi:hypothetical protein